MIEIKVPLLDRTIRVEVYEPPGREPSPGILLLHEIAGLNDFYREDAQDLANRGYLVYVPDLFSSRKARYCIRAMVLSAGRRNQAESLPVREVHMLLNALGADPACNGQLGMLGACLTGGFVIHMAKRDDMKAPVLYHHSLGVEDGGVPKEDSLEDIRRLQAHWAKIDPICPASRQRSLKEKLGDRLEDYYYWLPHGFRSTARFMQGSEQVWTRTIAFFDQHLKQTRAT